MDDRTYEIGVTTAVFLGFVATMAVAEAGLGGGWGVLVALVAFVLAASGAGLTIARRTDD
jgi:hypothetical protein